MNPPRLLQDSEIESAFASGSFVLFKHSLLCPVSAQAFREYMHFLVNSAAETGWISVTDERGLSTAVADRTGVQHESPQAFVLKNGTVLWHASHGRITRESLREAWLASQS